MDNIISQHTHAEPISVNQFPNSPRQKRYNDNSVSAFQTTVSGYPSGSSRDAKLMILNPSYTEQRATQAKKDYLASKDLEPAAKPKTNKTLAHFFESPSKFISVRAFNAQNEDQYAEGLKELKNDTQSKYF